MPYLMIAFGAIFLIALIVMICLAIYYIPVFKMLSGKKKEDSVTVIESPVYEPITNYNSNNNDDELLAVISAAVAAYLSDTSVETVPLMKADTKFKVVSFRKVR